jgi:3'(2'), 5'-bisphosphate nucleotidase
MQASDHRHLAEGLLGVALAAGRVQMLHRRAGLSPESKADSSPVTAADRESEAIILAGLARLAPGIATIAEESVTEGRIPSIGETFFLVDPLDGTKGYVKGRDDFTINIALVENRRPVFGLLYAPALADFYVTLGPSEAVTARLSPDASVSRLSECTLAPLRTRAPDPSALAALTSQSHLNTATARFLAGYSIVDKRAVSSSLKFGLIAKGEADLYPRVGPTSEWDTAAGHAVLAAAGGTVTTLDGKPLLYGNTQNRFINPDFVAWGREPLPPQRPS